MSALLIVQFLFVFLMFILVLVFLNIHCLLGIIFVDTVMATLLDVIVVVEFSCYIDHSSVLRHSCLNGFEIDGATPLYSSSHTAAIQVR